MFDTAPANAPPTSLERRYALIRGQIEHEDSLISQRLSWFVASQSFMFTAYAIVVSNMSASRSAWVSAQMHRLVVVVPVAAVLTCVLSFASIIAGLLAIRNLHHGYRRLFETVRSDLPPIQGYRYTQVLGQAAPLLLPLMFLAVWLFLLAGGIA